MRVRPPFDCNGIYETLYYVALPASMRSEIKARFARGATGSIFTSVAVGTTLAQAMGVETKAEAPKPAAVAVPAVTATAAVAATPVVVKPA